MAAKYFSISEVSDMLSISKSNLRYLESNIKNIKIKKIRGRRYYSEDNIKVIQNALWERGGRPEQQIIITKPKNITSISNVPQRSILDKIDMLESKFRDLQRKLA